MNQPTKSPKNKIKSFYKKRSRTWIVLTVLLFIVIGIVIYNKITFYIARNNAKEEVTKLIEEIEAGSESEVVFKRIEDKGCGTSLIGIGSATSCSYKGFLFFKNDREIKNDLKETDSYLKDLGFLNKHELYPNYYNVDNDFLNTISNSSSKYYSNGETFLDMMYFNKSKEGLTNWENYAKNNGIYDINITEEYVIGLEVTNIYHKSSGIGIFTIIEEGINSLFQ